MPRPFHRVVWPLNLVALMITLLAGAARAEWTVTSASDQPLAHVTINGLGADGLSVTDSTNKLIQIPIRDVVSLNAGVKINPDVANLRWKLALRNGDVLYGDPGGFSGQSLKFRVPELGTIAIPLKSVALLTAAPKPNAAAVPPPGLGVAGSDKDIVRLANNDLREGIVVNVDAAKVQLGSDNGDAPLDIPLATVSWIALGGAAPPRGVPPLSVRLNLASGSCLTVPLSPERAFTWKLSTIHFKDAAGQDIGLEDRKFDQISSIDILGGRLVYLSELDPASEDQISFLGTKWPMQVNKSVVGTPLRAGHIDFARGLGVHTQSTLVYDLDGTFDTLTLRAGAG